LRDGATDDAIAEQIRAIWAARDDRYSELRTRATESGRGLQVVDPQRVEMSRIGG
jgi:cyclic pyranopterin phosphate synthase